MLAAACDALHLSTVTTSSAGPPAWQHEDFRACCVTLAACAGRDAGRDGTCDGRPPAAGVVVEETHLDHGVHVVPLRKHDEAQAVLLHVGVQLGYLLLVELLLGVHYQHRPILHTQQPISGAEAGASGAAAAAMTPLAQGCSLSPFRQGCRDPSAAADCCQETKVMRGELVVSGQWW